jgi:hypothetical protein
MTTVLHERRFANASNATAFLLAAALMVGLVLGTTLASLILSNIIQREAIVRATEFCLEGRL